MMYHTASWSRDALFYSARWQSLSTTQLSCKALRLTLSTPGCLARAAPAFTPYPASNKQSQGLIYDSLQTAHLYLLSPHSSKPSQIVTHSPRALSDPIKLCSGRKGVQHGINHTWKNVEDTRRNASLQSQLPNPETIQRCLLCDLKPEKPLSSLTASSRSQQRVQDTPFVFIHDYLF